MGIDHTKAWRSQGVFWVTLWAKYGMILWISQAPLTHDFGVIEDIAL